MSVVNIQTSADGFYQSIVGQANAAQKAVNKMQMSPKLDSKGFVQPLGRITNSASEFQKSMDASAARVFAFGAAVGVINGISDAFKSLISSAAEVEKSLKDIQVVMEATDSSMQKFGEGLFDVARNTASSFRTVAESATELARQGLSAEETLARVNSALVLSRLSGLSAVKSTETLTAAINSFNKEGITHEQIVNRMANVDAAFAVSSADLAEAISRAGAVAQSSGVEFNELAAIVTAVQQRTARGGSVIGNGFKSIFTRIKRSSVREALEEIGVATQFVDGTFRSGIDIIKDYADTYRYLSDEQKAYTSEQIAGVYQIQNLQALIQDLNSGYSVYNNALDVANKTTNQATRRNEELNTTLSALFSQTTSSAKELASSIGELAFSDNFKEILTFLNNLAQTINGLFSETQGSDIAKTLVQGIGKFLTGPGLVIIGAAFIKIFALVGKFAKDAIADLLGLNRESKRQQGLQAAIGQILATNEKLYAKILAASGNSAKQEQIILGVIKQATAERQKQEAIIKRIAASSRLIGIGAGEQGFMAVGNRQQRAKGKRALRMANGFLPAINREEDDIAAGVGGARKGDKALKTKIKVSPGKRIDAVVNSGEYLVKNFQGSGADAVFNRDMAREYGLPSGAKKFNAASGLIPSFAGGLKLNLSDGRKITIREGQRVNEETLDSWIKDGAGVMTNFGFLSARQAGQARGGMSVIPWQLQGSPYSPEKYWTKGERMSISKGALGGFQARNSKKNLEKQKKEREKKKEEMLTINARNPGGATMLISNKGIMGKPEDRIYTGEDGEKYRMLYNVHGLNLSGLKTDERKIQDRIKTSMINQAGVFADEASGAGKFGRSNPEITRLTTPGSVGAAAGTIFETALRSIADNKLFSQNIGDTFDIVRPPDRKLKKLFGEYNTQFADAKINDNSGNLMSFHKKLYTHFGAKAKKDRDAKNKQSGSKRGARNFSRGFIPSFTSFMPSFAGGFIPNFAKGKTIRQKISDKKESLKKAKKRGDTNAIELLNQQIQDLEDESKTNKRKGKKKNIKKKGKRRTVGSVFGNNLFNKNSGEPSAPVSDDQRDVKSQNRMGKRIRRANRRTKVAIAKFLRFNARTFDSSMAFASKYGGGGLKAMGGAMTGLGGKIGKFGRGSYDQLQAAYTGGEEGLRKFLAERKEKKERLRAIRQQRNEQRKAQKAEEKAARVEAARQKRAEDAQLKGTKAEEREKRARERKEKFKRRFSTVAGYVTNPKQNSKILAKAIAKGMRETAIGNKVANVGTGFSNMAKKMNIGGISMPTMGGLGSYGSSKIKELSSMVNDIEKGMKISFSETKSTAGNYLSKTASGVGKAISGTKKGIVDATGYMFNRNDLEKENKNRKRNVNNTKENITEQQKAFEKEEKIKAEALRKEKEMIQKSEKIVKDSQKRLGKGIFNPYMALGDDHKAIIDLDKRQREFNAKPKTMLSRLNPFNQSPELKQAGRNIGSKFGGGAAFTLPFVLPMAAQAVEGTGPREEVGGMRGLISNTLMGTAYGSFLLGTPMGLPAMGIGAAAGFATGLADYSDAEQRRELSQSVREDASKAEMFQKRAQSIQQFSRALQQLDMAKTNNDAQGLHEANINLRKSIQSVADPELSSRLISVATSGGSMREKMLNLNNALISANSSLEKYNKSVSLGKRIMDESFDSSILDSGSRTIDPSTGEYKEGPGYLARNTYMLGAGEDHNMGIFKRHLAWWGDTFGIESLSNFAKSNKLGDPATTSNYFGRRDTFSGRGAEATTVSQDILGYLRSLSDTGSIDRILKEVNSGNREDLVYAISQAGGMQSGSLTATELKTLAQTNKQVGEILSRQNDADFIASLNQLKETIVNPDGGQIGGKFGDSDLGKILNQENRAYLERIEEFLSGDDNSGTTDRGITFAEKFLKALDGAIESNTISMNFLNEEQKQLAASTKKGVESMDELSPVVIGLTESMMAAIEAQRKADLMNFSVNNQMQISEARQSAQGEAYQGKTNFMLKGGYIDNTEAISRNAKLEEQLAVGQANRNRLSESLDVLNNIDLSVLGRQAPNAPGPGATASEIASYETEKALYDESVELAGAFKDFVSSNEDGNITLDEIGGFMGKLANLSSSGNQLADQNLKKLQILQSKNNAILQSELSKIDTRAEFAKLSDSLDRLAATGSSLIGGSQAIQARDIARDYRGPGSTDPKSISSARKLSQMTGVPEREFTGLSKAEADFYIGQENLKRFSGGVGSRSAGRVLDNYKRKQRSEFIEIGARARTPVGLPSAQAIIGAGGSSSSGGRKKEGKKSSPLKNGNPNLVTGSDGKTRYIGSSPALKRLYNGDPYGPGGIFGPPMDSGTGSANNYRPQRNNSYDPNSYNKKQRSVDALNKNEYHSEKTGLEGTNPFLRPKDYHNNNEIENVITEGIESLKDHIGDQNETLNSLSEDINRRAKEGLDDNTGDANFNQINPPQDENIEPNKTDSFDDSNMSSDIQKLSDDLLALSEVNQGLSEINQGLSEASSGQSQSISEQTETMSEITESLGNVSTDFASLGDSVSEFSGKVSESIQSTTSLLEGINTTANEFSESMKAVQESVEGFVENTKELAESVSAVGSGVESLGESLGQVSETIVGFPDALKEKLESVVMQMQVSGEIKLNFNTEVVKGVLGPVIEQELKRILVKPMIIDYLAKAIGPRINVQNNGFS